MRKRSRLSASEPTTVEPPPLLERAPSRRDWYPVGIAAGLTLLLVTGLLVTFGRVSTHERPAVFNALVTTVLAGRQSDRSV